MQIRPPLTTTATLAALVAAALATPAVAQEHAATPCTELRVTLTHTPVADVAPAFDSIARRGADCTTLAPAVTAAGTTLIIHADARLAQQLADIAARIDVAPDTVEIAIQTLVVDERPFIASGVTYRFWPDSMIGGEPAVLVQIHRGATAPRAVRRLVSGGPTVPLSDFATAITAAGWGRLEISPLLLAISDRETQTPNTHPGTKIRVTPRVVGNQVTLDLALRRVFPTGASVGHVESDLDASTRLTVPLGKPFVTGMPGRDASPSSMHVIVTPTLRR